MRRHPAVDELPAVVRDEEQDVQRAERERGHGEQVGRPDLRRVVAQEGAPGLARRPGGPAPAVAADGAGADGDPQLAQLAADALGAPQRVVLARCARSGPAPPRARAGGPSAAGSATTRRAASPAGASGAPSPAAPARGAGASRRSRRRSQPRTAGRAGGAAGAGGRAARRRVAAGGAGSPPPARGWLRQAARSTANRRHQPLEHPPRMPHARRHSLRTDFWHPTTRP